MGNTEAIAINHYLQETGQHLAQACTVPTAIPTAELGAHTGADTAVMSPQPPSQKSAALENKAFPIIDLHGQSQEMPLVGDEGLELLPFSAGSRAICVERDAESDANLHEKVVVEQFKLLQPLFSTDLKQALISELVGSLVER